MHTLKRLINTIISANDNVVSLVPKIVINSVIPTEQGVNASKNEKSTNEVINRARYKKSFIFR